MADAAAAVAAEDFQEADAAAADLAAVSMADRTMARITDRRTGPLWAAFGATAHIITVAA